MSKMILFFFMFLTSQQVLAWKEDTDRPGSDYTHYNVNSPEECQQACWNEDKCLAWTYVRPGVQGRSARCWLKDSVPPSRRDSCCISGRSH